MTTIEEPIVRITLKDCPPVIFSNPNNVTAWRIKTLFSKEPETIEWISTFEKDETLIDIGANVGMYTIWAAMASYVKVWAFEPESQNYMVLNKNIFINELANRVHAYPLAIGELDWDFGSLGLSEYVLGASGHEFGRELGFTQGCLSMSLDTLLTKMQVEPNHIKIDVDGLEPDVIRGARRVLQSPKMKSMLVEINTLDEKHMRIFDFMRDQVGGYSWSEEQINRVKIKDGPFAGYANVIFTKK